MFIIYPSDGPIDIDDPEVKQADYNAMMNKRKKQMKIAAEINEQPDGHVLIRRDRRDIPRVYFPKPASRQRLKNILYSCPQTVTSGIYLYRK